MFKPGTRIIYHAEGYDEDFSGVIITQKEALNMHSCSSNAQRSTLRTNTFRVKIDTSRKHMYDAFIAHKEQLRLEPRIEGNELILG